MNLTTNKYIGAFATTNENGFQQGFLNGGYLHRTLDLSPSSIQVPATNKLIRILREVRDNKLYICYALYSYAREKNYNRAGSCIGNSILIENARPIDYAILYKILNDLHTKLINDTNNLQNNVLQIPDITTLRIYDEHPLWNSLQVETLQQDFPLPIEKNKAIYILPADNNIDSTIIDFLRIASEAHYDAYESVYLPVENSDKQISTFVQKNGLLNTITWKNFTTPPPTQPPVFFSNILDKTNDYKPIFESPEGIEVPFSTTIDFDITYNGLIKKRPSDPWWVRYLQNDEQSNNQLVYYYCYYWSTETENSIKGICIATYGGTGDTKYIYSLLSSMYNDIIAGNETYKIPNNYQIFAKSCKSSGGNLSQLSKAIWQIQDYESKVQDDNHEGRVTDFFNAINTRYSPCIVLKKNEIQTKLEIKPAAIAVEKDSSKQSKNSSKLVIGFIVIIVGGIFLLLHTEFKKQPVYTDEIEPVDTATTTNKYESKSDFIEKNNPTITQSAVEVDTTVINKGRKKIEIEVEEPENYQQKEIPPKTKPTTNTLRAVKEDTSFMRDMRKDVRALEKTSKTKDNPVFYDNNTIEKADIAMQNNDYYQAIRLYTNAIAIKDQPRQSSLYVKRANAYLKQQRYNQVVDDCNKAIAINYYNGEAYKLRGIAGYNILEGEYDETLSDDLTKAIEYTPNDPLLYYYKGNMFYNKGWKELAKKYLEKAASLGMEDAKVLLKKYYTK